jgi:two-component system, chemotaxis family, protein-glutamate methylesterase/glutaminase
MTPGFGHAGAPVLRHNGGPRRPIRVLIVDDSALVRQTLAGILGSDPEFEVAGTAGTAEVALQRIALRRPDVVTLDLELPDMDGFAFLETVMRTNPVPVVVVSRFTERGSEKALRALDGGAVDVFQKPQLGTLRFFEEAKTLFTDCVKAAARIRRFPTPIIVPPKLSADAVLAGPDKTIRTESTEKIVVIGASTGGTEAIRILFERFSPDCPGIVAVQHMPEHFTRAFADRLDRLCAITVKEASDGDTVVRGTALVAPGNRHLLVRRKHKHYFVELADGPLVNRHRPSVDVLFRSTAKSAGRNAVGVLLTGMGDDGAAGLLEMKEAGAATLAQDEDSSVVFGMPAEAIKRGAAGLVLPLDRIPEKLAELAAGSSADGIPNRLEES